MHTMRNTVFAVMLLFMAANVNGQINTPVPGAGFRLPAPSSMVPFEPNAEVLPPSIGLLVLPAWKSEDLPFFCRIEHRWAKTTKTPLKFRLGSVDYVDWLEGKAHIATFAP